MSEYKFRRSYSKLILSMLLFACLGAVFIFMRIDPETSTSRYAFLFENIPFLREIMIIFCAGFVGICLFALFTGRPTLTANSEHLRFTSLFGTVTEIPWSEVQGVSTTAQYAVVRYAGAKKGKPLNIGGFMKMKPQQILDKLNEISGGRLAGRWG